MKKIFLAFILIAGFCSTSVKAQGQIFSIQYSMGFGTGNTNEFISAPSFRGLTFEYKKFITPNHAVGFETTYNFFYERKDYATYTDDNQSLSGVQFRYLHSVPLLASYDYFLKPNEKYNPYVGIGIGCNLVDQRLDMGIYSITNDAAQFAFRPEIGVLIKANRNLDLVVAGKYFVSTESDGMDGQSYFALNLGFAF